MNTIPFEAKNVPLEGRNLVEASAGTGKTYSIAILVLRLLLEKENPGTHQQQAHGYYRIDELLIVTYTKAAVAELQTRIRAFVKAGYEHASGHPVKDEIIAGIVNRKAESEGYELIAERLKAALLMLDEVNISTIHGFAGQMLSEFAFESRLSFGVELQNDISEIITHFVNEFYRKEISILPVSILKIIHPLNLKEEIKLLLQKLLSGKKYYPFEVVEIRDTKVSQEALEQQIILMKDQEARIRQWIDSGMEEIQTSIREAGAYAVRHFMGNFQIAAELLELSLKVKDKGYFQKLNHPVWEDIRTQIENERILAERVQHFTLSVKKEAGIRCIPLVLERMVQSGTLTFDGLIQQLHRIIVLEQNENLCRLIRKKFKAVFIDEFQDTDRIQLEVFDRLFIRDAPGILFLIGDPKQSIYAFRNADISSYLVARNKVDHVYVMNTNFRSSADMVAAVNHLYDAAGHEAAFGYPPPVSLETDEGIAYEPVKSKETDIFISRNGIREELTLNFLGYQKTADAKTGLANEVSRILNPEQQVEILDKQTGKLRNVRPGDIGILVNNKDNGAEIKELLQDLNIPAVQILDKKVLETMEAYHISMILQAMISPGMKHIRKALLLTFLNYEQLSGEEHSEWIFSIDENEALQLFSSYHQLVKEQKLLQAFSQLMSDFSIRQRLSHHTAQLRRLSNIEQIIQLINVQQYNRGWNYEEVLVWLNKSRYGLLNDGDEYTMQIESDEDAVKITTIHSSKGLEYNIVFIFGIHSKEWLGSWGAEFKYKDLEERFFSEETFLNMELRDQILLQVRQEQARLLYVALTRSVYQCNIFFSASSHSSVRYTGSLLNFYISRLEQDPHPSVSISYDRDIPAFLFNEHIQKPAIHTISFDMARATASRSYWWKMSYSALSEYEPHQYERNPDIGEDYDQFIFNILPRGTQAGIDLHSLFELLDFTIPYSEIESVPYILNKKLEAFNDVDEGKDYSPLIRQMVMHTLTATIALPGVQVFTLRQIENSKKLNELNFNFEVKTGSRFTELYQVLLAQNARISFTEKELEGLMTGFIDLFFEWEGKYFILDWKSNYLGYKLEDYTYERLMEAMTRSNYHLQYLIYTIAACKYLQSRKPDFDYDRDFGGVIYVYIRGARAGTDSGIFTAKPDKALVAQLLHLF